MQFEYYSHNKGYKIIPLNICTDIESALSACSPRKPYDTTKIRRSILEKLKDSGWSDEVKVDPSSKIEITSIKSEIGLCLQTGNMSRIYADALKLQTLYAEKNIRGAVYIVPVRTFAKKIGGNIANYERFIRELEIFSKTLTMPLIVFGMED